MKFSEIAKKVDGIPFTSMSKGKIFYDFIIKNKPKNCLELGFGFGVASSYIAGALDENNFGKLTIVDLKKSLKADKFPNITAENLLDDLNLLNYVDIVREENSYIWFLKNMIDKNTSDNNCNPIYDFVFIDGPKNFITDGLAFFLVDKLLNKNGWIVFDDYLWKYSDHKNKFKYYTNLVGPIDPSTLETPHIKEVYEKLVMQNINYSNFIIDDDILAWAQKTKNDISIKKFVSHSSLKYKIISKLKKLLNRKF